MAIALVNLLNTIEFHFLRPLPCLIFDEREIMIESLCKKLQFLQALLEDSEKNNIHHQARRGLETEIRDVARDAEGKIELELHQLYLRYNEEESHVEPCQSLYQTLQQVTREIESIERKIQIESNRNHFVEPPRRNAVENIKTDSSSTRSSEPKTVMVRCDDEFDNIMHKLISHSENLEVISIVRMGGIGKTTLTKRLYEYEAITSHFYIQAWATVSQEHNLREILLGFLGSTATDDEDISRLLGSTATDDEDISCLASQLRQKLLGQRYLIVIDDIWRTEAWDDIHRCFPEEDSKGSRILLTTRLKQVADYASSGNNSHYMRFLNPDESWDLFYKKVFEEKNFPLEFETVGRGIVKKCQGLPLTIVVVAGLLTSYSKSSLEQWENFAENLNSLLDTDLEETCSKILSLSYNHLPPHLKVCFLYFGIFLEDKVIHVKKLIRLWVAEGFLKLELNKTMEEVEPISRERYMTHTSKELRSFLYFPKVSGGFYNFGSPTFPYAKLLRVLDITRNCSYDIPSEIVGLVHLRYLALETCQASINGYQWFKLRSLQTITITDPLSSFSPNNILGLPQIRHVHFPMGKYLPLPELVQGNLQTLSWLRLSLRSQARPDFKRVPNLKELGIHLLDYNPYSMRALCKETWDLLPPVSIDGLADLHQLENLKIESDKQLQRDSQGMVLKGYVQLPKVFPPILKKLTLRFTYFPWEDMAIIGTLPNLEVLKLREYAFCGGLEWKATGNGFCKLKYLKVLSPYLKYWSVDADHFPVLECLFLIGCEFLEEFPTGFAEINTLQLIDLKYCPSSLVTSAKRIQEERLDLGDDKLVVRDFQVSHLNLAEWMEDIDDEWG